MTKAYKIFVAVLEHDNDDEAYQVNALYNLLEAQVNYAMAMTQVDATVVVGKELVQRVVNDATDEDFKVE